MGRYFHKYSKKVLLSRFHILKFNSLVRFERKKENLEKINIDIFPDGFELVEFSRNEYAVLYV